MLIKSCRLCAKLFVSLPLVVWAVFIYRLYLKSANDIENQWHYYLNPLEGTEFMNMHRDMFELTIDTPDPKLIGEGKDLFKPPLKKVRHFDNNIVLFSAVAGNSSSEHIWDTIDIVGWENKNLINNTYKCCVRFTSGEVQSVPATRIIWSNLLSNMSAMQFVCSNLTSRFGELPEVATLEGHNKECHSLFDWYLPVTFAHAHKNEIAVCSQIAYGSKAADDLLSWFELHRRLGVTKVLLFTHDLNHEATRVLQYYRALGMADTVPFAYPTDDQINHVTGENTYQSWNDEQITIVDCLARLRGYRYLALVDTDENLISNRGLPWMSILDELFAKYPDAAGVTFLVKIHIISPNLKSTGSQFKVGQYLNSTRPWNDRVKHVTMPDRVYSGGLHTHEFYVKAGFKSYWASAEDAVIHHFRACLWQWQGGHCTCSMCEQTLDDTVAKLFEKIEPDVLKLKAKLSD